jgi:hypothetical protein
MLASILIGIVALVAVSLSAALFLFAHLTGRIGRSTALGIAALAMALGAALVAGGLAGTAVCGPMAVPFGGFFMLAAGINGFVAYQAQRGGPLASRP